MTWMIYGAYGYTGELVANYAKSQGQEPVLAGRNEKKLKAVAERLELPYEVVNLDDTVALRQALGEMDLVVHCAGPFEVTAEPMIDSCIATRTHYLDITGELAVFEYAHSKDEEAKRAGIVICPGVGFDVIPTDCIAAQLKQQLPDANHLTLGFDSASRMSRGTAKTSVRRLGEGGAVRREGKIETVPLAYKTREIDFGNGEKFAMTIPWGDVSTAYYTTGIPSIEVFIPASPNLVKKLQRLNKFRWLLRFEWVKKWLEKKIEEQPAGPDEKQLEEAFTYVWGEAKNAQGDVVTLREKVMNGYKLTSQGAVDIAQHVLAEKPEGGYYTPAKLCGADLIERYRVS
ncbi:saccharopine dehydrogenase NADP-binding domain-containing protein [Pseudidiomarina sp. 1APP75-32.1]|uniref:Saccharopine dehydrogenase NADP-binding domain-containing protein n=1 Tax=Pseudidiomarina terrestris TaxID=2820060 RepID=A0AAW7R2A4_9GAMM|nr:MULTISPECIES: saccharopine dehydrogenase NADP-binding domain-containing protein [unclassified Pseudidiomarina]MDN7125325.1 saccharopine dehydrogenase NADP-binding domain-containing protein [Pseudidiomarina sp. 1APP75-32.1]MDN7130084.1 saccharopine dehydrogenase NADP-binding domain-containing protein [Pseudidiomarina sp. 1APR75-15]